LFTGSADAAPTINVHPRETGTNRAVTFQRLEWVVELSQTYPNPFDPEEIAVDGVFSGPDGLSLKLPGFWHQEYKREKQTNGVERVTAVGAPHWLIRFAAPRAGDWKLQVFARDPNGQGASAPLAFKVGQGKSPGFVRRSLANTRYFQFDSGDPFFIIGYILAWGRLDEYETLLARLSEAGGNYTRVWISPPNPVLETREQGLGRYDLAAAWHYEQILDMADKRGVYVLLTLKNYRDLRFKDVWGEAPWPISPYNKTNGGPALRPADFFTDPLARKMYQRHLRDLIARYSAFTSLAFWEFWNEQDGMELGSIAPWIKEMAAYFKGNDPYRHLVTTSFGALSEPEVWQLPDIDFTQRHFYGDDGSVRDPVPVVSADARLHDRFNKPHQMGELGISWRRSDNDFDPFHTAANLHNGLWAAAMSGDAGGATVWWWYDYIAPHNLWGQLTPLARFAKTINWSRLDFQPVAVGSPTFDKPPHPEQFTDVVFTSAGDWGKASPQPLSIGPDGLVSSPLPTYLYGPTKPDLRTALTLQVDLAAATRMIVCATRASMPCTLRVSIDDRPAGEFPFKPEQEHELVKNSQPPGIMPPLYAVAEAERNREAAVPRGRHTLVLDLIDGDWLMLESITLTAARPPQITGLQPLVLSDEASGEMIAWIHDPASNWHNDSQKIQPALFQEITVKLPASKAGRYKAEWWDAYTGEVTRSDTVKAAKGWLSLRPPPFRRDIALHLTPASTK
jgi:hypothetical protein